MYSNWESEIKAQIKRRYAQQTKNKNRNIKSACEMGYPKNILENVPRTLLQQYSGCGYLFKDMKLFMVHVGFYDPAIGDGIYETHLNYFIAASNAKEAKRKTLDLEQFKEKSMHIDGIKEISNVQGYDVILKESNNSDEGKVISYDAAKEL